MGVSFSEHSDETGATVCVVIFKCDKVTAEIFKCCDALYKILALLIFGHHLSHFNPFWSLLMERLLLFFFFISGLII